MQTFIITTLKIISLLGLVCVTNSCTRIVGMREVESNQQVQKQAPAECLAVFREFFSYVQKSEPDLITDEQAQKRWLSQSLRKALAHNLERFGNETNVPDYPSNQSFIGVWDDPTTYSIIGSRHYDFRNNNNPNDNRAVIDVLYEWDEVGSLDNQYAGEKSIVSFIFIYEDGAWKLDDKYRFTDEYASPGSLSSYWSR